MLPLAPPCRGRGGGSASATAGFVHSFHAEKSRWKNSDINVYSPFVEGPFPKERKAPHGIFVKTNRHINVTLLAMGPGGAFHVAAVAKGRMQIGIPALRVSRPVHSWSKSDRRMSKRGRVRGRRPGSASWRPHPVRPAVSPLSHSGGPRTASMACPSFDVSDDHPKPHPKTQHERNFFMAFDLSRLGLSRGKLPLVVAPMFLVSGVDMVTTLLQKRRRRQLSRPEPPDVRGVRGNGLKRSSPPWRPSLRPTPGLRGEPDGSFIESEAGGRSGYLRSTKGSVDRDIAWRGSGRGRTCPWIRRPSVPRRGQHAPCPQRDFGRG